MLSWDVDPLAVIAIWQCADEDSIDQMEHEHVGADADGENQHSRPEWRGREARIRKLNRKS